MLYGQIISEDMGEDYKFNMCHLGTIFMMDWDKDGRISLEDLLEYATMVVQTIKIKDF